MTMPHHLPEPLRILIRSAICLLVSLTACLAGTEAIPEEAEATAEPVQPELSHYDKLWKSSMFTSQEMKVEVPVITNADWAANLQLSGWSEVDGRLSVYLFRSDTAQTFILQQGEPAEAGVLQFVAIENSETIIDARVRVRLNGQEAWIAQQKESEVTPPAMPPGQQAAAGLQAPTTVDSRAARVRAGVVLTGNTTFEDSLVQPEQPASATAEPSATGDSETPKPSTEVLQRLRERHEHLYRMFPRPAGAP